MKRSLILVFSVLCLWSFSQKEWELIHGSDSSFNLTNVFMTDATHIWGTIEGLIYFSQDGGVTWDLQYKHNDFQYNDIFFLDNQTGWVIGWSEVLKTADGGEHWTNQYLPNPLGLDVKAVFFLNADTGWIAGTYKTIYVTYNGGTNWMSQHDYDLSNHFMLNDIHFYDPMHGCAVGGVFAFGNDPIIMTTEDGGNNWVEIYPPDDKERVAVRFVNEFEVWTCDSYDLLYRSFDRGFTWEVAADMFNIRPRDMHFFSEDRAVVCGGHNMAMTNDGWNTYDTTELQFANTIGKFSFLEDHSGIGVGNNNFLVTSNGGYTWSRINERFDQVAFFNPMNGWIIQEQLNKKLMHSTDGGLSWMEIETPNTGNAYKMCFPTDQVGYIPCRNLELLKTTDAGASWTLISLPADSIYFFGIDFPDKDTGFTCPNHGRFYKSVNGGLKWEVHYIDTNFNFKAFDFLNPREGWAITYDSICGHTTDGGLTWTMATVPSDRLYTIKVVNSMTGFISTTSSDLYWSTDGGNNWELVDLNLHMPINIEFSDPLNGWINDRANVYRTYDGGLTWVDSLNFDSENYQDQITDLFLIDSTTVWMCTMDGRVYFYSGLQGTGEIIEPELICFYPNPVSDQLTIEISNEIKDNLTIRIFSIDGKLLINKRYSGLHQDKLILDLSGLSSGLYLLNCQGSSVSKSYKLVKESR
jgi:photosystem II stability/assembly factor-like uncharacterized protein